ncbi:MAG: alpha/beta fold hydrolase [Isosphaeraceae bacterium]|nr:alpha/beta fold hydrolase [Isosphaeraceae bacterium]
MDSRPRWPRRAWKTGRLLALVGLVLVVAAYLAISLLTADQLTRAKNRRSYLDPRLVGPNATPWSRRTADGLTLRGWYYPTSERRHLIVLVHGMGGSWPEMAGLGRDLVRRTYDVLLFDLRGHGQSDPSRLSMGRRERVDIRAVQTWAYEQGYTANRIGWLGQSMGASTLLMEAARNPDIQVAVLDSPYGNLPELLRTELPKHSHLPSWFNPGIQMAAHFAYGVRTDDIMPIRDARRWGRRPLLLIHGEADSIVPVSQALQLARAAGPSCRAVTLPGVEHVQAYDVDPESYVAGVDSFFSENLSP